MSVITLKNDLCFSTVTALVKEISDLLHHGGEPCIVDLSQVHRTDSAGLAFLLEFMRQAQSRGQPISFQHIPKQLMHLAEFSRVDALLPIQTEPMHG